MNNLPCPFCDQINQQHLLYQEALFYCIYSRFPRTVGHCLIVPRRHIETFEAMNAEELFAFSRILQYASTKISLALNTPCFNIALQQGEEAGQSVKHLHAHILPRHKDDSLTNKVWINDLEGNPVQSSPDHIPAMQVIESALSGTEATEYKCAS